MHENIHKNEQVLQQIEWNSIVKLILSNAHFAVTKSCVLQFLAKKESIEHKLNLTSTYIEHLYNNDFKEFCENLSHFDPTFDAAKKLIQVQKHSALHLSELNEYAKIIEIFLNNINLTKKYLDITQIEQSLPQFKNSIHREFLRDFRKFVSFDGEVNLEKHPIISPLYKKQLNLEGQIRTKLSKQLNSDGLKNKLQFSSIDLINDRYVIPIKSDSYNSSLGRIISRSDSGHTLYVEPISISQENFQRLELIIQIQEILEKIELDTTKILSLYIPPITNILNLFTQLDEFVCRAKLAQNLGLSYPVISDHKKISLINSFHPLLINPVKNNFDLDENHSGLIISGPNTGGKTVTLKMIAITQLLLRYGFYIPCDHGEVYLYDKVFYYGNDQQDLNSGLSSFSAEVKNYTSLFDNLADSNLILIDEIFNSTSSEEASALAIAFFKKLHSVSNVHIIVSSHHQTLKTILHQNNNYISAHVGFNSAESLPTYKLHYGSPGASHALSIFKALTKNNSFFDDVYNDSLTFLDNKAIHYEKLLESLADKEHRLATTLSENQSLNHQLKNQKKSMEGIIKIKIDDKLNRFDKKLQKVYSKAENIISQAKAGEINKLKHLEKIKSSISHELRSIGPKDPPSDPIPQYENLNTPDTIAINQEYFCLTLKSTVTVKKIDLNKKTAHISKGNFNLKVPIDSLKIANKPARSQHNDSKVSISFSHSNTGKLEYDCRGMRLEEFQSLIEKVISDLLLGETPFVTIIHGHGTGVLKNWLRNFIRKHKEISIMPTESGNDGETRLALSV
jgi:DNA mismatch repair protein MutS2